MMCFTFAEGYWSMTTLDKPMPGAGVPTSIFSLERDKLCVFPYESAA